MTGRIMERTALKLLFFLLLESQLAVYESFMHSKEPTEVKVGVIIDKKTLVGRMCWASISMAVDDFYERNPNSSTRIALRLRDGEEDVIAAGSAALGLVNKERVVAILGPQKSAQAKFLATIADHSRVPLVTFSATSPFLSSFSTRYLLRMSLNDSSQVNAIASVVSHYGWREATIIYEDTEYGNGIIPFLIDALQGKNVRVRQRTVISPSAKDGEIEKKLDRLKRLKKRVFIAHLSLPLGERLFALATDKGLVAEGYAWIMTDGIASLVDSLSSEHLSNMQGFLGVKPLLQKSPLDEFIHRWKKRYRRENPEEKRIEKRGENPNIFSLWAYDATTALAWALEKAKVRELRFKEWILDNSTDFESIPVSPSGPAIVAELVKTNIAATGFWLSRTGLRPFRLDKWQQQGSGYQIVNVVKNGWNISGHWSSSAAPGQMKLETVTWPGNTSKVPRGWEPGPGESVLRVGVPVKAGFREFVEFDKNNKVPTGYAIDIFNQTMSSLPYPVTIKYERYPERNDSSASYDGLVKMVYDRRFDAVAGDITIRAHRFDYVDFTLPYTESGVYMIVPLKQDKKRESLYVFTKPLTAELWLCSLAFFVLTGFTVWIIESMEKNEQFEGPPVQVAVNVLYFAFSTAVFAHRQELRSGLSKMVVTVWVFAVLIITSTYTASLVSTLTAAKLKPAYNDIEEVVKSGKHVGCSGGSFLKELLKDRFGDRIVSLSNEEDYESALGNGTVIAIFHELPYIRLFLKKKCEGYAMVGPTHRTAGFGFAFRKNSLLLSDVSKAVVTLTQNGEIDRIERKWMQGNDTCRQHDGDGADITLHMLRGLFLVLGITFSLAIAMACILKRLRPRKEKQQRTHPEVVTELGQTGGEHERACTLAPKSQENEMVQDISIYHVKKV